MKIKLNETQNKKITEALQKAAAYREQFLTARNYLAEAEAKRNDILEMIYDAHGINPKNYDQKNIVFNNGEIVLTELKSEKSSTKIKRTLKSTPHDKGKIAAKNKARK
jgi:hypothetical protein